MTNRLWAIVILVAIYCNCGCAEERWVWSNRNRRDRAYREDSIDRQKANDKYRGELYERQEREREPTTKRPLPGVPQNDDIDDYVDTTDKNVGTRNYPFGANGLNGGQLAGNGFNNYPGIGFGGNNGILIGPGGPTGIIGRPQQYFPGSGGGSFPGGLGQPGFGGGIGGGGNLGYPSQGGNFGSAGGFPNIYGQGQGYPQGSGQYPGSLYGGGQFPGGQYPGNQYGGIQYPGLGQYPSAGGSQYPGGGPLYTEGYGLANLNGYPSIGSGGGGGYQPNPFGIGSYNAYGTGYDDSNQTNRKLQIEDKSIGAESRNAVDSKVDDKVNKNLNKTT